MPEPTLISVFLRKLFHLDSPVVRRLLEIAAVLALIWLAAIAKQREPSELGFVATVILTWAPIVVMIQFMFLIMTIVASGAKELSDLSETVNSSKLENPDHDKSAENR
jgi:hypothetical protein